MGFSDCSYNIQNVSFLRKFFDLKYAKKLIA